MEAEKVTTDFCRAQSFSPTLELRAETIDLRTGRAAAPTAAAAAADFADCVLVPPFVEIGVEALPPGAVTPEHAARGAAVLAALEAAHVGFAVPVVRFDEYARAHIRFYKERNASKTARGALRVAGVCLCVDFAQPVIPLPNELAAALEDDLDFVAVATLPPEGEFALQFAELYRAHGVVPALANCHVLHERAEYLRSVGLKLVLLFYQGCGAFRHRDPGLVGAFMQSVDAQLFCTFCPHPEVAHPAVAKLVRGVAGARCVLSGAAPAALLGARAGDALEARAPLETAAAFAAAAELPFSDALALCAVVPYRLGLRGLRLEAAQRWLAVDPRARCVRAVLESGDAAHRGSSI